MDAFRTNFPELFGRIIGYLHPIDLIALSLAAHRYADCYHNGFSMWRRNIIGVNEFILTISHTTGPLDIGDDFEGVIAPIHAGTSVINYGGRQVVYSYYGDVKELVFYSARNRNYRYNRYNEYRSEFEIPDNGKVKHISFRLE